MASPSIPPSRRARSELDWAFTPIGCSRTGVTPPLPPSEPSTADGPALTALLAPRSRAHTVMSDSAVSETSHDASASPAGSARSSAPRGTRSFSAAAPPPPPDREPRSLGSFLPADAPPDRLDGPRSFSGFYDPLEPRSAGESTARRRGFVPLEPAPPEPRSLGHVYAPIPADPTRPPSSGSSSNGISWHRAKSEVITFSRTEASQDPASTTTTTVTTTTTTTTRAPMQSPNVRQVPILPRRQVARVSHRRRRKAASHLGTDASQALREAAEMAVADAHVFPAHPVHTSPQEKRSRRRSSYLTSGFTKRKGSAFGWIPDQPRKVKFPSRQPEPIHPRILLSPFGRHWSSDSVVLYTNSIRAELNDLIFLTSCLQSTCSPDPLVRRVRHKNIQIDFELWFTRFSNYAELMLKGFEDYLFPLVTELLHQRDVMISRSVALIEAEGMSYVQAWASTTAELFSKMEEVRDLLSTVDNRLLRLQRNRSSPHTDGAASDVWNATFDSVRELVPFFVNLLDQLDERVSAMLGLGVDGRKGPKKMYRQFAMLITRDGNPPLGWSGISTVTRWIEDRKTKSEHTGMMARASKQSLFQRYRADNSHHTIVKIHKMIAGEDSRRRTFFT